MCIERLERGGSVNKLSNVTVIGHILRKVVPNNTTYSDPKARNGYKIKKFVEIIRQKKFVEEIKIRRIVEKKNRRKNCN